MVMIFFFGVEPSHFVLNIFWIRRSKGTSKTHLIWCVAEKYTTGSCDFVHLFFFWLPRAARRKDFLRKTFLPQMWCRVWSRHFYDAIHSKQPASCNLGWCMDTIINMHGYLGIRGTPPEKNPKPVTPVVWNHGFHERPWAWGCSSSPYWI